MWDAASSIRGALDAPKFKDYILSLIFAKRLSNVFDDPYKAILQYGGLVLELSGARNMIFDGFELRHVGPGATPLVVYASRKNADWTEDIVFRNNLFHDSYNDDLLKLHNGARFITVEGNVFYNQGASEQHMDVNSVTDITIQDNIFFNDFAGSGRINANDTKAFIVIKDSNENADGLEGSERITARRNIFLNWEGGEETFVQIGNDGKLYHEAEDVRVENNLMIGNSLDPLFAAFGVRGARNVTFANNTVVGDLPASGYALWVSILLPNPLNENIFFYNNIWSDPTGTMNKFSRGDPTSTITLTLDNNLYWNGSAAIPSGNVVSPLVHDARRTVADPLLHTDQAALILPRWNGSAFLSGSTTIRQEFERLANLYAAIPSASQAIGRADPAFASSDDLLGRQRSATPDLGAFEYRPALAGSSDLTTIWLNWSEPREPNANSLAITYTTSATSTLVTGLPIATRAYILTGLSPYTFYTVTLTARSSGNAILAQSNSLRVLTTDKHVFLPLVSKKAP